MEEIKQNDLMSKEHKKVCTALNYIEQSLILVSAITGCISISPFTLFVGIPIGIGSSAVGLEIAVTAGIQKYKPIIQKMRKKHDKIVLLAKTKFNTMEVLISKALSDFWIIDKYVDTKILISEESLVLIIYNESVLC